MSRTKSNSIQTKTNLIIFSTKKDDMNLSLLLCGQPIVRSESIKYLGTEITSNYKNMKHVEIRRKKVIISMNNLYTSGMINNQMSIATKLKLFKVYILSLFSRMDVNCSNLIQTN